MVIPFPSRTSGRLSPESRQLWVAWQALSRRMRAWIVRCPDTAARAVSVVSRVLDEVERLRPNQEGKR